MKHARACLAIAAALTLAAPFAASAQENESPYSWNVTAVSDYLFRGVSQTDEKPTLQAGFTYTSPVGLYAGVWGSGVDFGPGDPNTEIDYQIGYGVDVTSRVNFDVLLNRYTYIGASHQNYNELVTTTTLDDTYSTTPTS
nr:TorF family putative porin [Stenotrophomonas sp. TD3]